MFRCFTLNSTGAAPDPAEGLEIVFKPDLKHTVYLHDPDLFLISGNPVAVPRAVLRTDSTAGKSNVYIEAKQHLRWKNIVCR